MLQDTIHKTHTNNPLAVFAPQPVGVRFESQQKGEEIILLLRAHIATLLPTVFTIVIFIFFPLFAIEFLGFIKIDIFSVFETRQLLLIALFWYLFTFGFAFYKFIFWFFNVYIITNERIIDYDFKGILHKETAYANLTQIQDVTPKSIGLFATLFHYGNVFIQTAAEKPEFEFHQVEKPDLVAYEILEQVRKEEGEPPGVIA